LSALLAFKSSESFPKPNIPPAALEIIVPFSDSRNEISPDEMVDQVSPFLKYRSVLKIRLDQWVVSGSFGLFVTQCFISSPSFSQLTTCIKFPYHLRNSPPF
jgi:hypothetical protein